LNSLRLRLALLVVGAIVAVVGLATVVAIGVIGRPGPDRMVADAALQVDLISRLAAELPDEFEPGAPAGSRLGLQLMHRPAGGIVEPRLTDQLRRQLSRIGRPIDVVVTQPAPGVPATVSVPVPSQGWWITLPLSTLPPPPRAGWWLLLGWMTAITLGAAGIAVVISNRLVKPLQLVESAIAAVGPDGVLPVLPETGSGEMKATAAALNRLSARLKSAMESRMRLVAAAGHDLRTPMTRMRLRAEFIVDDEERALWLSDLEELDRIADSAIRLVREEVEASTPDPVDAAPFLSSLVGELVSQGHALELGPLALAFLSVTPLALARALRNLLINAATHGRGGRLSSRVEGAMLVIRIEDKGPGIPQELIERVFEPFFRVDPARRQSMPGAGLGLAIAKEIIERSGGTIRVTNAEGGGLVQEIRLPLAANLS
jgi:signal transduction histidine kinase